MILLIERKQKFKKYLCRLIFGATILLLYYLFDANKSDYAIFIIIFFFAAFNAVNNRVKSVSE